MEMPWKSGAVAVAGAVAGITGDPPVAYSTAPATLHVPESKGCLVHGMQGRALVYEPVGPLLNLLEHRKINSRKIARLRGRIEEEK